MIRSFKVLLIVFLSISVLTVSCGKKKKKSIDEIRKEFNQKPNPKYFTVLKKHYKEKGDIKAMLEISIAYSKAFPKDKYIKEDIGKYYAELASKEKGEKKLSLLIKAVDYGYTSNFLTKELSELVGEKIKAFEKNNNDKDLEVFLKKAQKLPLDSRMRMTIDSKLDFLKNKAVFNKFFEPFKKDIEGKVDALLPKIFPRKEVVYDKAKGNFVIKAVSAVAKGDSDKNNYAKTKNIAYNMALESFTILKYALEHGKRPPVGKEFKELFFPKEDFHCDGVVLSKDKKALQLTCTANIVDLGKAFFAVREEENKDKKEVKKEEKKQEKKEEKKQEKNDKK